MKPAATCAKKLLQLGTLGVKSLQSHSKSDKHKAAMTGLQQTPAIEQYCRTSGAGASKSGPGSTHSAAALVSDLHTAVGSTPALKAEVLWTLHAVTKHHS